MEGVLVVGSGGREAAIAEAMDGRHNSDRHVVVSSDVQAGLDKFSGEDKPFVIIGPKAPLVAGLADDLREDGYVVFGAGAEAAEYEASKAKTVRLAREAGVVHPDTYIAEGKHISDKAFVFVEDYDPTGYVIKADGLAGGKGVELPQDKLTARYIVEQMLNGEYGGAGKEAILFADRKYGPEVSAMVVVGDGKDDFVVLPLAQDHKRLRDGDEGPNTGGMGAYAPVPESIVNHAQYEKINAKAYALLEQMEADGVDYTGAVMYMGHMMSEDLTEDEFDLLEINVRFGDPESQVIFPLLKQMGVDSYRLLKSAAEGSLEKPDVDFSDVAYGALTVCLAASGYPKSAQTGELIEGAMDHYEGVSVQFAGANFDEEYLHLRTSGGRVLYVTGVGESVDQAAERAYKAIGPHAIHFAGMQYRKDIGHQARNAA